jgi:hypothetical protein
MKKIICVLALTGVAALGFSQTGVIKELSGVVEIKTSGTGAFVPAGAGTEVLPDTIISTGFRSTALVQIGSASIAIRPLTRLTLSEIQASQGTETLNMNLQSGRVRVELKPPAGTKASLGLTSPIATASVRGTSFDFDTRNIEVHSGGVNFMGKWGYAVLVREGYSSGIGKTGTAGGVQNPGNADLVSPPGAGYDDTAGTTGGSSGGRSLPNTGTVDVTVTF